MIYIALGIIVGIIAIIGLIILAIGAWGHSQDLKFYIENKRLMVSRKD